MSHSLCEVSGLFAVVFALFMYMTGHIPHALSTHGPHVVFEPYCILSTPLTIIFSVSMALNITVSPRPPQMAPTHACCQ